MMLAAAACSLVVDTSGLATGVGSLVDGGPGGGGGGAETSSTEGGGGGGDGDGGDGGDGASSPCGALELCEDFEGGGTLSWMSGVTGPVTLAIDGVRPKDGNKALHVKKTGSGTAEATIAASLPPGVTARGCTFDAFVELTAGPGPLEVFAHYFYPAPADTTYQSYQALAISVANSGSVAAEIINPPSTYDGVPLPAIDGNLGRWVRVKTEVTPATFSVSVNGGAPTVKSVLYRPAAHERELLIFGMNYEANASSRWEIFVDNIRCTLTK